MAEQGFLEMPKRPSLEDLIVFFHAQPGVEYLLCAVQHQIDAGKAENGGWRTLPGAPYAKVDGQDCVLMYRGEVLQGASVQTTTPRFFFDPILPSEWFAETNGHAKTNGQPQGRKGQ